MESTRPRSRREFLATGAAAAAISSMPFARRAGAADEPLKFGVVGAGGRGTGACADSMTADPSVELMGMADIGSDRMEQSLERLLVGLERREVSTDRVKVDGDHMFTGPDAFKRLMDMDLDYVILATPPGFRPLHYEYAVERGLHAFVEKPLSTDPVGCRKIRATAEKAEGEGLGAVGGG
jgi:predicted dehydrogenase